MKAKIKTVSQLLILATLFVASTATVVVAEDMANTQTDHKTESNDTSASTASALDWLNVDVGVLFDFRAARTDSTTNWIDGGLGKARYGGSDGSSDVVARLDQASFLLDAKTDFGLSFFGQLNVDAEPANRSRGGRLDFTELYFKYDHVINPYFTFETKAGAFHAPISLENEGPGWNSLYTLTPSAINSWYGEELRTFGPQFALNYSHLSQKASLFGSVFKYNDPAGALLAWRGWTLGSRQSGISDKLPLAAIDSISENGLFPQAPFVEPFEEIDHSVGYYAGVTLADFDYLEVRALHYDNQADPNILKNGQYGWHTTFESLGARAPIGENFEILSQYLFGTTRMGRAPDGRLAVDNDFYSDYLMGTYTFLDKHRISLRHDRFRVKDNDFLQVEDNNEEIGYAWTIAHLYDLSERHRFGVELTAISSDRPARADIGAEPDDDEYLVQVSYRFTDLDIFASIFE